MKVVGAILAAGKGTRFGLKTKNKTATLVNGKSLIEFAYEAMHPAVSEICVVVGHQSNSVKKIISSNKVSYVEQPQLNGTAVAVQCVLNHYSEATIKPDLLLVGNGDNMVFMNTIVINELMNHHMSQKSDMTILTFQKNGSLDGIDNGRILKDEDNFVMRIVESRLASKNQLKINELNTGFYCFSFNFLVENLSKIQKNKITGEFHITELVEIARKSNKKVLSYVTDNEGIGLGINTKQQLSKIKSKLKRNNSK